MTHLGESNDLRARQRSHARRFRGVQVPWLAMPGALKHQRHEREVDLIGGFYQTEHKAPRHLYGQP